MANSCRRLWFSAFERGSSEASLLRRLSPPYSKTPQAIQRQPFTSSTTVQPIRFGFKSSDRTLLGFEDNAG